MDTQISGRGDQLGVYWGSVARIFGPDLRTGSLGPLTAAVYTRLALNARTGLEAVTSSVGR